MDVIVILAVIAAAALHAIWNALAKTGKDKHLSMAAIVLGHAPFAAIVLLFAPLPAAASWPFLLAGIGLHFGYQLFLLHAYRIGDLTQVYPIALVTALRETSIVFALAIGVMFLKEKLSLWKLLSTFVTLVGAALLRLSRT